MQLSSLDQLRQSIAQAMLRDQHRLRQRLRAVERAAEAGKPFDNDLTALAAQIEQSVARRAARQQGLPTATLDASLPIAAKRDEIAAAIERHPVTIVCGETGSGKSTQLPKICLQLGRGVAGLIGHTQPRRIAARSIANRVAQELGTSLGQAVGFKVRFTDATSPRTYVKLMTDGILLAETQGDRFLEAYDMLIIDEAHERSLNIDFLLGYLRQLLPKRPELKVITTSATIDAARFSEFFASPAGPAPVIEVSGRAYPVELRYRPPQPNEDGEIDEEQALADAVYELAAIDTRDILIFMPTERDIRETAKLLRGRRLPGDHPGRATEILPLYARLSTAEQNRVFQPHSHRRIVIATNVAESSLTVPGIGYVIDPGTARISRYSPRSKVQRLPIEPISQASADQRKGRCGREGPGVCIRLYSEADYANRERYTPPEIQRTNLAAVILQTMALRLGPVEGFPLLDPPKPAAIRDGYATLFELGAIDERNRLAELGRRLSRLPVDPRIGRIILAGAEQNCLHEILIIAAALEVQDPRDRPAEKREAADAAHARWAHPDSDFLTLLNLWDFFHKLRHELSHSRLRKACLQNFLSYVRMREWVDLHLQLLELVREAGLHVGPRLENHASVEPTGRRAASRPETRRADASTLAGHGSTLAYAAIHRALLTGLLSNVAYRSETYEYTGAGGNKFYLWPGSALFEKRPGWVMAAEMVETTKRYLRTAARIDPEWVEPLAGHLVERSYSEPHWHRRSSAVLAYEKVSLFGMPVVPKRRVRYGEIDPKRSRELFIEHALVEGDFETRPLGKAGEFLAHNLALVKELRELETKARRRDLLRGEEAVFDFYEQRLPADVYDGIRLLNWLREVEHAKPRVLYLAKADLLRDDAQEVSPEQFPDEVSVDGVRLALEYHLEPGSADDGVTVVVPQEGLAQLRLERLGWLVPGLLEERVTALIRSLPKDLRRTFVPVPETARAVLTELAKGVGSRFRDTTTFEASKSVGREIDSRPLDSADLLTAVAASLSRIAGRPIPREALREDDLPPHLRMNIRVVDAQGKALATDRDLGEIRRQLGQQSADVTIDDPGWTRDGITRWDFGDLPERVAVRRGAATLNGFPTLLDQGASVALRLLDSPDRAAHESRRGVRRLFCLAAQAELKKQVEWLPNLEQCARQVSTLMKSGELRGQLADLLADRAFLEDAALPRTADDFQQRLKAGRGRLAAAVQQVANLIGPLCEAYHKLRLALAGVKFPSWHYAAEDIEAQLAHLTDGRFLAEASWTWLVHYPRYLRAAQLRLEKLGHGGLPRDQERHAEFQPRWQEYLELAARHREQRILAAELTTYRWMLEEYRVALFAQELGTAVQVSPKRLEKQWAVAGR